VLVLDRLGPRADRVGQLELERRRRDERVAVAPVLGGSGLRALGRLAQVVEEQVDRRARELARPLLRGRVERDADALEAVAAELAAQQLAQRLVEVGDRRVERDVDDEGHEFCGGLKRSSSSATESGTIAPFFSASGCFCQRASRRPVARLPIARCSGRAGGGVRRAGPERC
jgi:hypothetical protein